MVEIKINKRNKLLFFIGAALLVILIGNVLYRFYLWSEYSDYLKKSYPDVEFKVGRVKYDFIYDRYFAIVNSNDGIRFIIDGKKEPFFDKYLELKHKRQTEEALELIIEDELNSIIEYIHCRLDNIDNIEMNKKSIIQKLQYITEISIQFNREKVNSVHSFVLLSNKVINKLEGGEIPFKTIVFTAYPDDIYSRFRIEDGYTVIVLHTYEKEIKNIEQLVSLSYDFLSELNKENFTIDEINIFHKNAEEFYELRLNSDDIGKTSDELIKLVKVR